jgi:hypothetical protein
MATGLRPPSWIFENLKISGNSPCGFEVGHQISKGSIKQFKRYPDLKIPKWRAILHF